MGIGERLPLTNRVDLNIKARTALSGLSATPEKDIANLLRSDQQIAPEIRKQLANALEGKLKTLELNCTAKSYAKETRRFLRLRKRLNAGRDVAGQTSSIGYNEAIKAGCIRHSLGEKTIEASITMAKTADAWIKKQSKNQYQLDPAALELVYLYAKATNRTPTDCLRSSASAFPILMEYFDRYTAFGKEI